MAASKWSYGGTLFMWADSTASVGGLATFAPLNDDGSPLFKHIDAVFVTGGANTATITSAPHASLKQIAGDMKSVTVNVFTGTILGILGATLLPAPDGTTVYALLMGY